MPELRVQLEAYSRWLDERGQLRSYRPLLATKHGTHMATAFAWRLVKRVGTRADVRPQPEKDGSVAVAPLIGAHGRDGSVRWRL